MSLDVFGKILNAIGNQFATRDLPLGLPLMLTCVVRSGIIREDHTCKFTCKFTYNLWFP